MSDDHQKAKEVLEIERTIAVLQGIAEQIKELEFTLADRAFYSDVKKATKG